MTRIIVHAGFHKTGTTSLQTYLAQNRTTLAPWFDYYGQNDFKNAGARARIYAQKPFPWRLLRFRLNFRAFLRTIPNAATIVLSRETFVGVMPGHRDWRGRMLMDFAPAAVPLCQVVISELKRRFGAGAEIEFLFTTRERESWIRSVYGHLLRSIHLTESFEEFRAGFPDLIDLTGEANRIAPHLKPCKLHLRAMEDYVTSPTGPAGAVLELAGVPQDVVATLPSATRANAGQTSAQEEAFLAINRQSLSKAEKKARKEALLAEGPTNA
jgi:hypothetical protein